MKKSLISNFRRLITNIRNWTSENKMEFALLVLILVIGAFFRLYKIDQYMTFLGDEGRDVIIVRRLLVDFDPILVGPGTSIGNMYLGPLYYYMMAPALLLSNLSPVGPAVMIALLGIVTVFFVWYVAREWFGKMAAFIASLLYATAPVIIIYSRSSWNPNIMPFFALSSIYAIWQVWQKNSYNWLYVLGISLAFALQSHYLGLLLFPIVGLFWLLTISKARDTNELNVFAKKSLLTFLLFLLLMSPLFIFDARHGWRNVDAMKNFFTMRQTTVSAKPWTALPKLWPIFRDKVTMRLISGQNAASASFVAGFLALFTIVFSVININGIVEIIKNRGTRRLAAYFLVYAWLGVALVGLGVYKQEIYDHYYGFFFAAPFILIGAISSEFFNKSKFFGSVVGMSLVVPILISNLQNSPLRNTPNRQLQRTQKVSQKITEKSEGEPFNIAVIAERNYEGAYLYFLEVRKTSVIIIDPQKADETITEQLFVVCELENIKECDPTHNPKAEVANFGWSKIEDEWDVDGIRLYKLVHTQ